MYRLRLGRCRLGLCITPVLFASCVGSQEGMLSQGAVPPAGGAQYALTEIGTLGGAFSSPAGISDSGVVAGYSTLPGSGSFRGFTWKQGAKIKELPTFGGPDGYVWTINRNGLISGPAETDKHDPNGEDFNGWGTHLIALPAVWSNGRIRRLPLLSGGNQGNALGSNAAGEVGGTSEIGVRDKTCVSPQVLGYKPVIWKDGKIQKVLPTWPGDSIGGAIAVNDRGDATGSTGFCGTGAGNVPFNARHAVLWRNGKMINLGRLGCAVGQEPLFINDQDQIVGLSNLHGCKTYHGFLWNGEMQDLGALPGDCCSVALAMTASGAIIGQSCAHASGELVVRGSARYSKNCRGVIWEGGTIVDFNTLIAAKSPLFVSGLDAVNRQGLIVGDAFVKKTGESRAFLATPLTSP